MNVSYVAPFQRAWWRVERMLFHPFTLQRWLTLGFAAFLAEYLSGGRGYGFRMRHHEVPVEAGRWAHRIFEAPWMLALAAFAGVLVLIAVLVLQWVSCRGKFIFLDGVVSGRAAIVEPWKRFARPGNSLFAWTIVFWITACLAFILAVLPFLPSLRSVWEEREFNWGLIPTFAGLIAILVPLALVAGYILLFLSHFVVPIMYRHGLTATAAWSRFLALLREHVGSFLIYGVLVFLFHVAIFGLVFLVGFSTCCVGFLLFATPYIGEVVLLPVLAWVRALGPEFVAQFGPDFDLFGAAAAPAPAAPATAAQTPAAGPPGGATP